MIYIWRATCLKQYRDGWIIVTGANVEEAREVARAEMTAWSGTEDARTSFTPTSTTPKIGNSFGSSSTTTLPKSHALHAHNLSMVLPKFRLH